ncbi:MAG: hypothetical protein ACQEXX_25560 [Bacillota bacterium]
MEKSSCCKTKTEDPKVMDTPAETKSCCKSSKSEESKSESSCCKAG